MSTFIQHFAKALPPEKITNQMISLLMDTSDEWIVQRTGIEERYWVTPPMTTSDLAVEAAKETLKKAEDKIPDAIIAATLSPDFSFPGIGVQIQAKLGLTTVPAFDIRNQCSGFLYAIEMAKAFIETKKYKNILVVGAEVHSTGLDKTTRGRDIAVLFGDGAGACLVTSEISQKDLNFECIGTELHSDGNFVEELWCEHPGSAHFPTRVTQNLIDEAQCFPKMNGKVVFQHAVKRMTEVSESLLKKIGISKEEISLFLPHQANLRINASVAEYLGLKSSQVFNTIQKYGNTTAATIPIGFSDAVAEGKIQRGDIILSAAFGAGFTWGAAVFRVS